MNRSPKKQKRYTSNKRKWLSVLGLAFVFIAIAGGIFLYHNFFRQTHARLIETVPTDASFIFQINDDDVFVKSSKPILPYLNDLFSLDAFTGFQFFIDKIASTREKETKSIIISGHGNGEQRKLLFSTKISEAEFERLLKTLRIDPRNNISFDQKKIYNFGTHYRKFQFVYHNNIFSVSEDLDLLKRSVSQLKNPRNLLSDPKFSEIFAIVEKNTRQNWLIIQHARYFDHFADQLNESYKHDFLKLKEISTWSAYQVRFTESEINLAGYSLVDQSSFFKRFEKQAAGSDFPAAILPLNTTSYVTVRTSDYNTYADNLGQQANTQALSDFKMLKPVVNYLFSIEKDTSVFYYQIVQADSSKIKTETLLPANYSPDSAIKHKQFYIYSSKPNYSCAVLFPLYNITSGYFTENQGYYIFSESVASLEHYINLITTSNSITDNSLYNFSKANLPSEKVFELFYNNHNLNLLNKILSEEGKKNKTLKALRLFSCSFSPPQNGVIASNIYIKLVPVSSSN